MLLFALMALFSYSSVKGQGPFTYYPTILYKGENIVTIFNPVGIERITFTSSRYVVVNTPGGFLENCPDSINVSVTVNSVTAGESVEMTLYDCAGRRQTIAIETEDWTIKHEYTGEVPIGTDTCLQCFVQSSRPKLLDSIRVSGPNLSVQILDGSDERPYRISGFDIPFRYNVCFTPVSRKSGTDTIYLYFRRDYPNGGLTTYVISKPVSYSGVDPLPEPARKTEPIDTLPYLADPTTFRNIALPTAESQKKGEWYYGNYLVIGHLFGYGVTDRLSLMGGGVIVPDFISRLYLGTIGARYEAVRMNDFRLAVGAQLAFSSVENSDIRTFAPYAVASYGDERKRLTAALGYGLKRHFTPSEVFDRNALVFGVGGNIEIARGWKLAGELYSIESSGILPALITARKFNDHFAFDFGLGLDLAADMGVFFTDGLSGEITNLGIAPYLSFMWVFH